MTFPSPGAGQRHGFSHGFMSAHEPLEDLGPDGLIHRKEQEVGRLRGQRADARPDRRALSFAPLGIDDDLNPRFRSPRRGRWLTYVTLQLGSDLLRLGS